MKTKEALPQLISIKGMQAFFKCSRPTLYSKYMPHLKRHPTTDNRVMYLFEDVQKLKERTEEKEYEEVNVENEINETS